MIFQREDLALEPPISHLRTGRARTKLSPNVMPLLRVEVFTSKEIIEERFLPIRRSHAVLTQSF
jgi:hypothetical protein